MKMLTPDPNLDGQIHSPAWEWVGRGLWLKFPGLPMQVLEESPFEKDTALEQISSSEGFCKRSRITQSASAFPRFSCIFPHFTTSKGWDKIKRHYGSVQTVALEATEWDSSDNVPTYKIWLPHIKLNVYGVTKAPCPQGKSQVFTIAESQLNSDYPGEGELGKAERIGAFPGRKKGEFCDWGGQGKTSAINILRAAGPSFVFVIVRKLKLRVLFRLCLFTYCALTFKNPEIKCQRKTRNESFNKL